MKEIELYPEPRKALLEAVTRIPGEPEMNEFESSFLCGLIRETRPHKILEIGISGGGTSAVVMQCVEMLGYASECEIYSLDLNEKWEIDNSKVMGFMIDDAKSKLKFSSKQQTLLGKVYAEVADDIGGDIDFVLIDTVHSLPGEMFDFLCVMPYLKDGAMIILHDVAENYISKTYKTGYATKVIFDVVTADKYFPDDKTRRHHFSNIAAFQINEETRKNIIDCFSILTITWSYIPDDAQISAYKRCLESHYDKEKMKWFDRAVKVNQEIASRPIAKMNFYQRIRRCGRIMLKGY